MLNSFGARIAALPGRFTLAAALLAVCAIGAAAPGFITGSKVTRGSVIAELTLELRCDVQYLGHSPAARGDQLRVQLDATGICKGTAPSIADSREQYRPLDADDVKIVGIEYDGESPGGQVLRFDFSEEVRYDVRHGPGRDSITLRVFLASATGTEDAAPAPAATGRRLIPRDAARQQQFVINLESSRRPPATADLPGKDVSAGRQVLVAEAQVDGVTWYRTRLGYYDSADEAARDLRRVRTHYPTAWIDRAGDEQAASVASAIPAAPSPAATKMVTGPVAAEVSLVAPQAAPIPDAAVATDDKVAELMRDARRAMTAGELSRAVQIYTKVLQLPPNPHQQEAQEYLALARERNGQMAHAKAEYQRYLELYPDSEGAERVSQRLAALTVSNGGAAGGPSVASSDARTAARRAADGDWRIRTFFSQFYRRDVNQLNDDEEIVSQSSVYSDVNIDARRRGERFDFTARVTAGYRSELLDESSSNGNDLRVSYAYADLADARTRTQWRIGRQTRNTGGVLGRFDGMNIGFDLSEKLRFEVVGGQPVYSTAYTEVNSRTFYGASSTFRPFAQNVELGVFALQQQIEGMTDRQALGGEFRYFGESKSLWGMLDYDTAFAEIGSFFVQGSWRLPSHLTLTGMVDRRRSPFLSIGSSLIGQKETDINVLTAIFTEDELRQIALDRSAENTTMTVGVSSPLSPRLQVNLNASLSTLSATPESAGIPATPATDYSYYSADLVASSLFTQSDVTIFGLRYADAGTTEIWSMNIDSRFPLGRALRISPRLRVDYRQIRADDSTQWIYTPGLRLQYRWGKKLRLELETGKQFSSRAMETMDLDRESWFVNLGYQFFY
ncbi:MAG: hypothetical protein OEW35_06330 [Gammaproteobacteria bacterium]|nr:hypothetical protein [Gammaproteobacteria bacterium]MDH4253391.1 hypothetical protein [Gammaproteobacteria bacterium]MDH5310298.1 hypothetical protein [Gammaproteobacteria bacterium]